MTKRFSIKLDYNQSKEQAGFRPGFGTNDQLVVIKVLIEKCIEYNKPIILVFVNYEKTFDSVSQLFTAIFIKVIKHIYDQATALVALHENTDKFSIKKDVRQGAIMSPNLSWNTCLKTATGNSWE